TITRPAPVRPPKDIHGTTRPVRETPAAALPAYATPPASVEPDLRPAALETPREAPSWAFWFTAAWAGGAVLVLSRLLVGLAGLGWLARRARPVTDASWVALAQRLAAHLALKRPVTLLQSDRA